MFRNEDSESEQTDNQSLSESTSGSCDLSDDKLSSDKLLCTPGAVQEKIDILPATPDTPVLPATPASLVNHSSLLSPGLSSPGAQSTSSGSGGGPDPVHDLPAELLAAGWRRFWSRRERRPYFYNKLTTESRWEMPTLPGQVQSTVRIVLITILNSQRTLLLQQLPDAAWNLKTSVVTVIETGTETAFFAKPIRTETAVLCLCIDGSVLKWSSSGVLS